jgi:hypothetical protein
MSSEDVRGGPTEQPGDADAEEVPLQVTLPRRIKRALDVRAAESGQTKRAIVLKGLQLFGIDVTEDELIGRRGVRRN